MSTGIVIKQHMLERNRYREPQVDIVTTQSYAPFNQPLTFKNLEKFYKEKKLSFYYDEKKPKNRICVSGNFAEFSFHPRDHLFWGNREDLIDLFALPLDTWAITDKIKFIQLLKLVNLIFLF